MNNVEPAFVGRQVLNDLKINIALLLLILLLVTSIVAPK